MYVASGEGFHARYKIKYLTWVIVACGGTTDYLIQGAEYQIQVACGQIFC